MNKTFTRTASGVRNYSRFFGDALVVYIEGKISREEDLATRQDEYSDEPRDILFYKALFSHIGNGRTFVFKCVGNKENVLHYGELIRKESINDAFIIIDRDYDGIHSCIIDRPEIIYTYGYSWENDFWTEQLALHILSDLTVNSRVAKSDFVQYLQSARRRIGYLARLDSALRPLGKTILPKNGGSCGVSISSKSRWFVPASELRRIRAKFNNFRVEDNDLVSFFYQTAIDTPIERVIQGHLYEHIFMRTLHQAAKRRPELKSLPHAVVYNLAHSRFLTDVRKLMHEEAYKYYQKAFERLIVSGNVRDDRSISTQPT